MTKLTKNHKRILTREEIRTLIDENKQAIRTLFLTNNLTAKEVANIYNCDFSDSWSKELFRQIGSKKQGHGGARKNSGNKKNVPLKIENRKK
jgi:hypothetical protein